MTDSQAGPSFDNSFGKAGTTRYEYDSVGRFSGFVYAHGASVRYQRGKAGS